ncbi:MAG TPA: hypothetical protein DC054_15235 [Blastocatellia bacterium]|nr:hypothetical protein [Blastocatellia bacterium]
MIFISEELKRIVLRSLSGKQFLPKLSHSTSHRRWRQSVAPGVSPGIKYLKMFSPRSGRQKYITANTVLLNTVVLNGNHDARMSGARFGSISQLSLRTIQ